MKPTLNQLPRLHIRDLWHLYRDDLDLVQLPAGVHVVPFQPVHAGFQTRRFCCARCRRVVLVLYRDARGWCCGTCTGLLYLSHRATKQAKQDRLRELVAQFGKPARRTQKPDSE